MERYTIRGSSGHPSHPPLAGTVVALYSALGLVAITVGGWIGGSLVFEHGVRVQGRLPLDDAPRSD